MIPEAPAAWSRSGSDSALHGIFRHHLDCPRSVPISLYKTGIGSPVASNSALAKTFVSCNFAFNQILILLNLLEQLFGGLLGVSLIAAQFSLLSIIPYCGH